MIYEVEGDILLSGAEAIAHGIAANDPMNQGLAYSLHVNYPAMHKDFHHWCKVQHPKTGSAWIWSGAEGARVINLITQEGGHDHGHVQRPLNDRRDSRELPSRPGSGKIPTGLHC